MKVDSLKELKTAFDLWRRKKRYAREPVPDELLKRARRAIEVHGLPGVVRVTKIDGHRLTGSPRSQGKKKRSVPVPTFSRLELSAPSAPACAIAEVETATGVKLRIFTSTPETLGLLSALCGVGGGR